MPDEQEKQSLKRRAAARGRKRGPDVRSMLSAEELRRRPSRPADYATENQALIALAQELASAPEGILQKLADTALGLCHAHSAGLSLLEEEDGKSNFHWRAIAGQWAVHLNGGTPRNFGPCGTVLDLGAAMICSHPEVDFPYWEPVKPVLEEALLIPFYIKGEAAGTIWVVAHDTTRRFDAEDLRLMTSLGTFAATAYQTLLNLNAVQRVADFAEAEVQQLQRLDAIGQITSGVAHDFNNLLNVVLTNAHLLSRSVQSPDDQEGIELIRSAAERGAKLIAQLLAFSRQQQLEPQEVDLNGKLVGMGSLLRVTLGGTVQLKATFAQDLWPALVDPNQIEMIVLNLAINARDAMQPGGTLTLETFNTTIESASSRPEEPSPGDYVAVAVKDTGIGISDGVLPHVFEPFFTTKEPGKGSGLGLAQVFGFAKQSGGGVRIETGLSQGTVVTIFLPRAAIGASDDKALVVDTSNRPETFKGLRVLVVDDDKAVLKSTVRLLDSLGYAAASAESATEALRLLATNQAIDLVLADFAMPEMSGRKLAKAIHARRPTLPVVLMTGHRNLALAEELNGLRVILKPFTEEDLVNAIGAVLQ